MSAIKHHAQQAERTTLSGEPIKALYGPEDAPDHASEIGAPGEFPFTRGVYPSMYRGRLWTMRQFAGFGTAEETNERFRYLLDHGQTGLSTAFDMPSLMGHDSDSPRSLGEVGREGVAIDTVTSPRSMPWNSVSMSSTVSIATPSRPTSPSERGESLSWPMSEGMSNAVLRPVWPWSSR